MNRVKFYHNLIRSIPGWYHTVDFYWSARILSYILNNRQETDTYFLEIGIHYGKSFIPIYDYFLKRFNIFYACDVFSNRIANVDNSGFGSREEFEFFLSRHAPSIDKAAVIEDNSLNLPARFPIDDPKRFVYCSIDGGHTYDITISDLQFCASRLTDDGIIIVDDVYNYFWCEVGNAFFDFLNQNNEFKINFILQNKVVISKNQLLTDALFFDRIFTRKKVNGYGVNVLRQEYRDIG